MAIFFEFVNKNIEQSELKNTEAFSLSTSKIKAFSKLQGGPIKQIIFHIESLLLKIQI